MPGAHPPGWPEEAVAEVGPGRLGVHGEQTHLQYQGYQIPRGDQRGRREGHQGYHREEGREKLRVAYQQQKEHREKADERQVRQAAVR